MTSLRDLTIKYLNPVSKIFSTRWLTASTNQKTVLPFYHAVSDKKLPHIDHLYRGKSTKEFLEDLEFLLRYFTPVDYLQFKEIANSRSKPGKPVFLLSFDDGLSEFHDVIAPILIRKGIPAVCFLNSAFIDNKDLFFKYKASVLVSSLEQNEEPQRDSVVKSWMKDNSVGNIKQWLLSVDYANKSKLDEFASKIGYDFGNYLHSVQPYLTTAQIQKLIKEGFHFGAHSIDHPEYRYLSFEEQLRQTTESVDFITKKFGLSYSLFAFPFTDVGVSKKFFTTIMEKDIVELSFGGAGLKKDSSAYHFQRIAFERGKLPAEEIYKTEIMYSEMLNLIGKNTVRRV